MGDLGQTIALMIGEAQSFAADPGVYAETVIVAAYERTVDFGAGAIDAIVVQGYITLAAAPCSGLLTAGSKLQKLAGLYNTADTAVGIFAAGQAAMNIAGGKGGGGDALALVGFVPVLARTFAGPKCFTPDDHFTICGRPIFPPMYAATGLDGPIADDNLAWYCGGIVVLGLFGWQAWERRNRRRMLAEQALRDAVLAQWQPNDSDEPMDSDDDDDEPTLGLARDCTGHRQRCGRRERPNRSCPRRLRS